jgi:UDP-N-acetylglucosamine--N-acetylmuramyl-(pentapeptide) pyrophosphoryl-undecaprenol N-acetylglucosamine transferase
LALVDKEAALYVKDANAHDELVTLALATIEDEDKLTQLRNNILNLAHHHSAEVIADEVIALAIKYRDGKQ